MSVSITDIRLIEELSKAGPFVGPRGGKWADAKHTIPYKEGGEPSSKGTVKVTDEVLNAHSGQVDALLTAKRGGRQAGRLHYSVSNGVPHIQKIEVGEKRAGVGSKLVAELASKYGYANIEWGMMTESGNALRSALDRKYGFDREAATPKKIDGQAFGQKYGKVLDHNHISNKTQEVYVEMDSKKKADALASEVKRLGGEVDMQSHDGTFWADVRLPSTTKKSISIEDIEGLELLSKAGPFIGPRGGKWADAKHTIPYKEGGKKKPSPGSKWKTGGKYEDLHPKIVHPKDMDKDKEYAVWERRNPGMRITSVSPEGETTKEYTPGGWERDKNSDPRDPRMAEFLEGRAGHYNTSPDSGYVPSGIFEEGVDPNKPATGGGKPSSSGKLSKVKTWKKRTDAGGEVFSVKIKPGGMFESFNISRSSNESLLTVKMSDGSLHNKRFQRDTMDDNKLPFALADKLLSGKVHPKEEGLKEIQSPGAKKSISIEDIEGLELLAKSGPFIGPKGGKWADAKHTIAWKDKGSQKQSGLATSSKGTIAIAAALKKVGFSIDKNSVQKKGNKIVKMPLRDGKGGVLALGASHDGRIAMVGDKASVATAQMRLASVGMNTKPHESKAVEESGMGGLQISPGKDGTFNWNEAAFQSPEKNAPKVIPQTPMSIPKDSTGGIVASPQPSLQELSAESTIGGAESTYDSAPKFEEHPDAPKDKSEHTFGTYAMAADLTPAKVKKTGPDAILKYLQGMTAINAHRIEPKKDSPVRHMAATVGPNSRVFIGIPGGKGDAMHLSGPGQMQAMPRGDVKPGDVYFSPDNKGRHTIHVIVGAPHKTKIGSSDWWSNPSALAAQTYPAGSLFGKKGARVIEYRSKVGMIASSQTRFGQLSKSVSVDEVEALELLAKSSVVAVGKRGGKIYGYDSKNNPIYSPGEAAKKKNKKPKGELDVTDAGKESKGQKASKKAAAAAKVAGKILGPELIRLISMNTENIKKPTFGKKDTRSKEEKEKEAEGKTNSGKDIPEIDVLGDGDFEDSTKGFTPKDHREAAAKILAHRVDASDPSTHKHNEQARLHVMNVFMARGDSFKEAEGKSHKTMASAHRAFANEAHKSMEERAAHKAMANSHALSSKTDAEKAAHSEAAKKVLDSLSVGMMPGRLKDKLDITDRVNLLNQDKDKVKSFLTAGFLGDDQASIGGPAGYPKVVVEKIKKIYSDAMSEAMAETTKKSVLDEDIEALYIVAKATSSADKLSAKISKLISEGYPEKQAVAIAHKMLGLNKGEGDGHPDKTCEEAHPGEPHVPGKIYEDLLKEK